MSHSLRKLLPTTVTFASLVCAFTAIVLHGEPTMASICILAGYVLDGLDGELARRLGVASAFGLQLDSLVDVVTFGVAPSVLVYEHLRQLTTTPAIIWVACVGYLIGGVFRLARFNLLPMKNSRSDCMGLTISTSGATLALSVLCNHAYGHQIIPVCVFPMLMVILTLLMVSRIRYPGVASILQRRWLTLMGLGGAAVLAFWFSPRLTGFGLVSSYISFGLIRAAYGLIRKA